MLGQKIELISAYCWAFSDVESATECSHRSARFTAFSLYSPLKNS